MRRIPPPLPAAPSPPRAPWRFVPLWRDRLTAFMTSLRDSAWRVRPPVLRLSLSFKPRFSRSHEARIRAALQSDFSATVVRTLAYLGALAVLGLGSAEIFRSSPVGATIESSPPPEWIAVSKPFPAFALNMPELADSALGYGMRRHIVGGGRRDTMTWGDLSGQAPHLMVEIYRPGSEFTRFRGSGREIAALTDGRVSAMAVKPLDSIDSKFGPVSLAEFSAPDDAKRKCLGFVRSFDQPLLQITGWYCMSGRETVDRSTVACALDRLTLLAAASEPRIGELFARAELKRTFCGQRSPLLAATPKLGPNPGLGSESKLRGAISAQ